MLCTVTFQEGEFGRKKGRKEGNQGGSRIKKKCLGSNFLVKPHGLDLPTYVIRDMSIYGNMTSSL